MRAGRAVTPTVFAGFIPAFAPHPGAAHTDSGLIGCRLQADIGDLFHPMDLILPTFGEQAIASLQWPPAPLGTGVELFSVTGDESLNVLLSGRKRLELLGQRRTVQIKNSTPAPLMRGIFTISAWQPT